MADPNKKRKTNATATKATGVAPVAKVVPQRAPQSVGRRQTQYIPVGNQRAQQGYENGLTIASRNPAGGYSLRQKDGRPVGGLTQVSKPAREYNANYLSTNSDNWDYAQMAAYGRENGWSDADFQQIAEAVNSPSSRFYNPYFKGRVVQNKAESFLREYFGGYDGAFDENFFEQTADLAQYEIRDSATSTGITSPGKKGTPEQWAAYYRIQLQNDMSKQYKVDEEWQQLRSNAAEYYKSFQQVYGRKPTRDEFLTSIDMSKYKSLSDIDDSRNLSYGTSHAPVELNKGTYYSKESLAGLYGVLLDGGDISEDRDYTEDAILYWMRAVSDAPDTRLAKLGYDTSKWTDEDYTKEMQKARQAGDHELWEALKANQFSTGEVMDGVDRTDYLGEKYGYDRNEDWFKAVERDYAPIWERMYTDSTKTSIKKPTDSEPLVYHAAYQAWQLCKMKDDTQAVEQQAQNLYADIKAAYDESRQEGAEPFESKEDFKRFLESNVLPSAENDEYKELQKYMAGNLKVARDAFISEEEIDAYVDRLWDGDASNGATAAVEVAPAPVPAPTLESTISPEKAPVVTPKETQVPPFYNHDREVEAANSALKRTSDAKELADSLVALSASGTTLTPSQLVESGIPLASAELMQDGASSSTLCALWLGLRNGDLVKKMGENANIGQKIAVDPVLKMLSSLPDADAEHEVTFGDVNALLNEQTVSQMSSPGLTIADGVIQAVFPGANDLYQAMTKFCEPLGLTAVQVVSSTPFDVKSYNDAYKSAKDAGYGGVEAANIALNSMMFVKPGLSSIGAGLEDDEAISSAVTSITEGVTGAEGYADSVSVVSELISGVMGDIDDKTSAATDAVQKVTAGVQQLSSSLLLGMSDKGTPAHQAATKDLVAEAIEGDVTKEDISAGVQAYLAMSPMERLDADVMAKFDQDKAQNTSDVELMRFGKDGYDSFFRYEDVNGSRVLVMNDGYMDSIRAADPDAAKRLEEKYSTSLGAHVDSREIPALIMAAAQTYGHDDTVYNATLSGESAGYDERNKLDKTAVHSRFGQWFWTALGMNDANDSERTYLYQKLTNYSNYFTPEEALAISAAWGSGYLTYEGAEAVIDARVSQMSIFTANYYRYDGGVEDSSKAAESFIDKQRALSSDLKDFQESGFDYGTIAKAREVENAIYGGSDPYLAIKNAGLAETLGVNEGDDTADTMAKLNAFLSSDSAVAAAEAPLGSDYTDEQIDTLEKMYDVFVQMGALGFDFAASATDDDWKNMGVDFAEAGLNENALVYLDDMTDGKWREPFGNEGIGFGTALLTGSGKGIQSVGNIWANATRFTRDVLSFLPFISAYEPGDGSYVDRVRKASSMTDEYLSQKATGTEEFWANVTSEFVRNRVTGAAGVLLGQVLSGASNASYAELATRLLAESGADARSALQNYSNIWKIAGATVRGIDAQSVLQHLPFGASVAFGSYNENRDEGKRIATSVMRALVDTAIEMATETPAIENINRNTYAFLTGNIDLMPDSVIGFALRTGEDVWNEVSQEEMSLVASKIFDAGEASENNVGKFFSELYHGIVSQEFLDEAGQTALSTAAMTLMGAVLCDLPDAAYSKAMLKFHMASNQTMDLETFSEFYPIAIAELEAAYEGDFDTSSVAFEGDVEAVSADAASSSADTTSSYDPTSQTPSFGRKHRVSENGQISYTEQGNDSETADSTESKKNVRGSQRDKALTDVMKKGVAGELQGQELQNAITDELKNDPTLSPAAKNAARAENVDASQEQSPASDFADDPALSSASEKAQETAKTPVAHGETPQQKAERISEELKDDPTLSPSAKKVARYMADSEVQKGEALAQEVKQQTKEALMAQDTEIQNAQKQRSALFEAAQKAQALYEQKLAQVTDNMRTLRLIYQAAADEGIDFNAPNVQNAVIANQQATNALRSEAGALGQKAQDASEAEQKATQELEEVTAKKEQEYEAEARKAAGEARKKYEEARAILYDEVARQNIHERDEQAVDSRVVLPSERGYDPRTLDNSRLQSEEEEQYIDYGAPGSEDRDNRLNPNDASTGTDDFAIETEFATSASEVAGAVSDMSDKASKKYWEFAVQIPKTAYDRLIGIFERMPGGDRYLDAFFRHVTNSEDNADARPSKGSVDKTADRARELTSGDYTALEKDFGIHPVYETDDEIILKMPDDTATRFSDSAYDTYARMQECSDKKSAADLLVQQAKASLKNARNQEERRRIVPVFEDAVAKQRTAEVELNAAKQAYAEAKSGAGFAGAPYAALRKADVGTYLKNVRVQGIVNDIDIEYQRQKVAEEVKANNYDIEHLRELLLENTNLENESEENRELIRKSIESLSKAELIEELATVWYEENARDYADGLLKQVPYVPLENDKAVAAYVREHGGRKSSGGVYENLETRQSYFVHAGLLELVSRHRNALRNSNNDDLAALEAEMRLIDNNTDEIRRVREAFNEAALASYGDTEEGFLGKLFAEVGSITDTDSGMGLRADKRKFFIADRTSSGVLRVPMGSGNSFLKDASGNYLIDHAMDQVQYALRAIQNGDGNSDYEMYVVENTDAGRVRRRVGAFYEDVGGIYMPTYSQIMRSGNEVYVRRANALRGGNLDFTIEVGSLHTKDALKETLDSAERRFQGLFSASEQTPSAEDFRTYATAYLNARRSVLNDEINSAVRTYRLNGDKYDKEHCINLAKEITNKRSELQQIDKALRDDASLQRYIDAYRVQGSGVDTETAQAAVEALVENVDVTSPEAQAAIALVESAAPATEEEASERVAADTKAATENAYRRANAAAERKLKNPDKNYSTVESILEERVLLRTLAGTDRVLKGENVTLQRLNLLLDEKLTKGMSAEEKANYYADRANEARNVDATPYRYNKYQELAEGAINEALHLEASPDGEVSPVEMDTEAPLASEEATTSESVLDGPKAAETSQDGLNARESDSGVSDDRTVVKTTETPTEAFTASESMDANKLLQQAFEEQTPSPELEAALNENYPQRITDDATEAIAADPVSNPLAVDEYTSVGLLGTLSNNETLERGRDIMRQQNALIKQLNRQIDEFVPLVKAEWENGAQRWSESAQRKQDLLERRNKASKGTAEYASLTAQINGIVEYQHGEDGDTDRESFLRWLDLKGKKEALQNRRNIAKQTMKDNSQKVNGSAFAKQLAEGNVQYNPHMPIAGAKDNKTGVQIAKDLLSDMYSGEYVKMRYDKKTALTVDQVAEMFSDKFDQRFYESALADAEIISKTRRATERASALDAFRVAVIDEKLGHGSLESIETAKEELVDAYQAAIIRKDFSKAGYDEYRNAMSDARNNAMTDAYKIIAEYEDENNEKTQHALQEERTNLSYQIEDDRQIIDNMISVERAYYRLGNGDIAGCLRGDEGGQLPAPLMNVFLGMLYNATENGKGSNAISRIFDSPERIAEGFAGKYAPFIQAVFIRPALSANDAQKAEISNMTKELEKMLPKRKIEVAVTNENGATVEEMSLREIVGHIIDERTNKEYADVSDDRYVAVRLSEYGIKDAEIRQQIEDAVDYARNFNDQLYARANEALFRNGHRGQTYGYRRWYMHHYSNEGDVGFLARLAGIHTNDEEISQIYTDDTADRRPSHEFNAASLQRHGKQTGYDFFESVQRSLNPIMNTIYQTGNIDRLKQLEQAINGTPKLDEKGNYVMENNKTVIDRSPMFEVDADGNTVNKNRLLGAANEFGQFSQRAANKRTGNIDRAIMRSVAGRKAHAWVRFATSLRSAAAVAFNPMSAITNVAPVKFLLGICRPNEMASAMATTIVQLSGKAKDDDYVKAHSAFVQGRTAYSAEERSIQGKVMDYGYAMAGAVDTFTTNYMVRALFNHEMNMNNGNAEQALAQAEDMARRMLTDKSRVGRSQFYENTALGGLLGQFQQESVNELMYMLKDMKYYGGGKMPKALLMMLGVFIFNGLFNLGRGSEGMPDPIGAMLKAYNNMDEDASLYDKAKAYGGSVLETLNPVDFFVSGELATTSSIKDIVDNADALFSKESDIWDFVTAIGSAWLPGGTTAKRAYTGIKSVSRGYAESTSGNVKFLTGKPNALKYGAAALGGVNLLTESKAYTYGYDSGLKKKDSESFKELVDSGLDATQAWQIVRGTADAKKKTKDAKAASKDANASGSDIRKAEEAASEARNSVELPKDTANWGVRLYTASEDNAVRTGVALWKEYGVTTYPTNFTVDQNEEGAADKQAAMEKDYRRVYSSEITKYLSGRFGEVGSKDAAVALEKALRKDKQRIKKNHTGNEGGDE